MRKTVFVLVVLCILISFSGCVEKEQSSISLVLGAHQHFPQINISGNNVFLPIYEACLNYGHVSTVIVGGKPTVCGNYEITKPQKWLGVSKLKQIATKNAEQIIAEAEAAVAQYPEIDTLAAISESARLLLADQTESKTMLVFDSGLSTTGLLDFASLNLLNSDPKDVVNQLKNLNAIPNCTGVEVIWTGLGEVCGEQHELTTLDKASLREIWESILLETGAKSIEFVDIPLNANEKAGLPNCKTVPIVDESLAISTDTEIVRIGEEKIQFKADSSELISKKEARLVLVPIANYIKTYNLSIMLAGSTATYGSEQECIKLSQKRADAIKRELIELGVDGHHIQTVGIGQMDCPMRVKDRNSQGLIESKASQNRAVFILFDLESDCAKSLQNLVRH